ncbi:MAG: HEAT repeat domain-containing protein [Candidatus Sericytochromatia bacterium]
MDEPSGLEPAPPHGRPEGLEPALGAFAEALRDAQEPRGKTQRVRALIRLGSEGDPRGLPALLAAAADADWVTRKYAVSGLGLLGLGGAVETVASAMADPEPEVRRAAARALRRLDDGRRLPLWLGAIEDADWRIRGAALEALPRYGPAIALPAALAALADEAWLIRYMALSAVKPHLEAPGVLDALLARLAIDAELAPWLAPVLAEAGPASLPGLLALLPASPPWRKLAIASALGRLDDDRAREALTTLFGHPDPEVEEAVTRQGAAMRGHLQASLGDADWVVRWHACSLLGQLGDPAAAVSILPLLQDGRMDVRLAALTALRRLASPTSELDLTLAARDPAWRVRLAALEALAAIATPTSLEPVVAALGDPRSEVRQGARQALLSLGPAAEETLVSGLLAHPALYDEIAWLLKNVRA